MVPTAARQLQKPSLTVPFLSADDCVMKLLVSLAFAVTLVATASALPASALASPNVCDGVPKQKITGLKAQQVSCAKARKVAMGWKRTGYSKGFSCGYYPIRNAKQIETVRCAKGDAVVTFKKRWVGTMPFPTFPPIQLPSASAN
jgi:hypothetical protein